VVGDYVGLLKAKPLADEALASAKNATKTAYSEKDHYKEKRREKVNEAWDTAVPVAIGVGLCCVIVGWLLFGFDGCMRRSMVRPNEPLGALAAYTHEGITGIVVGAIVGVLIGVLYVIYKFKKVLR